jgi:hypothetical protein
MTAFDFEGNDWDDITESEKRSIVDRLVRERDALSDDYETLVAEHDLCPDTLAAAVEAETHAAALGVTEATTTDCPLRGVHAHAFRGPHRFHEWDPIAPANLSVGRVTITERERFVDRDR